MIMTFDASVAMSQYDSAIDGVLQFFDSNEVTDALVEAGVEFIQGNIDTASYPASVASQDRDTSMAALSEATIEVKEADGVTNPSRPGIWTGDMRNSVEGHVEGPQQIVFTCRGAPQVGRGLAGKQVVRGMGGTAVLRGAGGRFVKTPSGLKTPAALQSVERAFTRATARGKLLGPRGGGVKLSSGTSIYPAVFHFGRGRSGNWRGAGAQPARPFMVITMALVERVLEGFVPRLRMVIEESGRIAAQGVSSMFWPQYAAGGIRAATWYYRG